MPGGTKRAARRIFAGGAVAVATVNIDLSGLNVGLEAITRDLDVNLATAKWVLNGYLVAFAAGIIPAGRLSDVLGRRRTFVAACIGLAVASLLAGAGPTAELVIAGRILQGFAAAAVFPAAVAAISFTFSGDRRSVALGSLVGISGVAAAAGPVIGGVLTDAIGWRWILLDNIPLALLAVAIAAPALAAQGEAPPEPDEEDAPGPLARINASGAVVLTGSLVLLLFALDGAENSGWGSVRVVVPGAIAAAGLALFFALERRVHAPLLDLNLFRDRVFSGANAIAFLGMFAMLAPTVFIALYLQRVLNLDPLDAGLTLGVVELAFAAAAPLAGRLVHRSGPRILVGGGTALLAVALILLVRAQVTWSVPDLIVPMILIGLGAGAAFGLLTTIVLDRSPEHTHGVASGTSFMAKLFGAAVGLAVTATIFAGIERGDVARHLDATGVPVSEEQTRALAQVASDSDKHERAIRELTRAGVPAEQIADHGFVTGMRRVMLICGIFAAALAIALLPGRKGRPLPDAGAHARPERP
jgi:EmrB/QacA subfamily drug resistance transporter